MIDQTTTIAIAAVVSAIISYSITRVFKTPGRQGPPGPQGEPGTLGVPDYDSGWQTFQESTMEGKGGAPADIKIFETLELDLEFNRVEGEDYLVYMTGRPTDWEEGQHSYGGDSNEVGLPETPIHWPGWKAGCSWSFGINSEGNHIINVKRYKADTFYNEVRVRVWRIPS